MLQFMLFPFVKVFVVAQQKNNQSSVNQNYDTYGNYFANTRTQKTENNNVRKFFCNHFKDMTQEIC